MKVLYTTSRMPFAVDEIRKLGENGHEVYTAETFRHRAGESLGRGPRAARRAGTDAGDRRVRRGRAGSIDERKGSSCSCRCSRRSSTSLAHRDRLAVVHHALLPGLRPLAKVHDKVDVRWRSARRSVCRLPKSVAATSPDELQAAIGRLRPSASPAPPTGAAGSEHPHQHRPARRNGVASTTPSPRPTTRGWSRSTSTGVDRCSWSVVHDGSRSRLHCTYEHPGTIEHAAASSSCRSTSPDARGWRNGSPRPPATPGRSPSTGWSTTTASTSLVECNPRPTDGCTLMRRRGARRRRCSSPGPNPSVVPAGRKSEIKFAVLRDMFREPANLPQDLRELFEAPDIYHGKHDLRPFLYEVLSYSHVFAFRHHEHPHAPQAHGPGRGPVLRRGVGRIADSVTCIGVGPSPTMTCHPIPGDGAELFP